MKVVPLAEAKNDLSRFVDAAQGTRVLVTRHGRPAALIIGVEGEAIEDLLTASDPDFWRMIEARRREPTVSAAAVRRELGLERTRARPARGAGARRKAGR
jgi:prevent-host-death family protein